mmetsp:Transcript_10858/g.15691  ORF Transcript_10858/g.15691 Transcript_10858/m.15691 type:complete len:84 (+) Transcript_10858:371-622(+)
MLNQMAKMRQPLCVSEGLALANALIEGTEWEQRLLDCSKRRLLKRLLRTDRSGPFIGTLSKCTMKSTAQARYGNLRGLSQRGH